MPVPGDSSVMSRSLLRDQAYERLREAITTGVLHPAEKLNESELVGWLGISRTPIREALTRLERDGLVQTTPGRLTRVSPLDGRSASEAQMVVAALHETAVRDAVPVMSEADLDEMTVANQELAEALESQDVDAAICADDAFHAVALRVCGNRALISVIEQYTPTLRRLERLRFSSLVGRTSVDQHEHIISLCKRGAAVEAAVATRANWQTLSPVLQDLTATADPGGT